MQPSTAAKQPAGPFTTTLKISRWPYCPLCGQPLRPDALHTFRGVVFCPTCCTPRWKLAMSQLRECLIRYPELKAECSMSQGVLFYTPRHEHKRGTPLYNSFPNLVPIIVNE